MNKFQQYTNNTIFKINDIVIPKSNNVWTIDNIDVKCLLSINNDVIGKTNKNGIWTLSIEDYSSFDQQRITTQWKYNARYLAEVYRQDIIGESQY